MARVRELAPGTAIAGFRVVHKLSEGGMGAVYLVTQEATGRQRALKVMHPELVSDEGLREKFIQEARIGGRVESEHVVDVVDAGIDSSTGMPWLAMELLVGEDLGAMITRRGRVPMPEIAAILEQVCHAVGAAHAAGIVHRDLKPENIFLAQAKRANRPFTVKVLDFGIAKLVEEARSSTNTGIMGSPFWMAPEQTERRSQITPATDVWAIGLVAYRLLTGRHFWLSAADAGAGITVFLRELVIEPLVSASERARQTGVGELIVPGFDVWFARCVVRDQSARFAHATAALAALRGVEGAGLSVPPPATGMQPVITVRTSSASTESATALGSARTVSGDAALGAPSPPALAAEDDEAARRIPTQRMPLWPLFAGFAALAGMALYFTLRAGPAPAPHVVGGSGGTGDPTAPVPVEELRCPKTMAAIPSATFWMGSSGGEPDEKPVHAISLNGFCLDTTEVLVSEFAACVAAKGCAPAAKTVSWEGIKPDEKDRWSAACNAGQPGRDDHPINCVTWDEADGFCRWAHKRLPTEEEWELAARGAEGRTYPWGREPPTGRRVNACGGECAKSALGESEGYAELFEGTDGYETTAPAASFKEGKTPEGIFNLAGNVWEWTFSHYCQYPGNNCAGQWRVARGGAWNSDAREGVRASRRDKNAHDARTSDIGFRCAI